MLSLTPRIAALWCTVLLIVALARVHFRVVTTTVAYHLGQLKGQEGALLEKRSVLQAELAKLTNKKHLLGLSHTENEKKSDAAGGTP